MNESIKIQTLQGEDTQSTYTSKANYNFHLLADYITGVKGIEGPRGKQGIPGIQGPKGDTGENGEGIYFFDENEWDDFDTFVRENNLNERSIVIGKDGKICMVGTPDPVTNKYQFNYDENGVLDITKIADDAINKKNKERGLSLYTYKDYNGAIPYIYTQENDESINTRSFLLGKNIFAYDDREIPINNNGNFLDNHLLTILGSCKWSSEFYRRNWWKDSINGICISSTQNFDLQTVGDYNSSFIINNNWFNHDDNIYSESILNLVGDGSKESDGKFNSSLKIITYGNENINNISFCSGKFLKSDLYNIFNEDEYSSRINNAIVFDSGIIVNEENVENIKDASIIATAKTKGNKPEFIIRTDSNIFEILSSSNYESVVPHTLIGGYGINSITKTGLDFQFDTYNKAITLVPYVDDDDYLGKKTLARKNYCDLTILNGINGSITIGGGEINNNYYYNGKIDGNKETVASVYNNMGSIIIRGGHKAYDSFYGNEIGIPEFYKCGNILIASGDIAVRSATGSGNGCIVIDSTINSNKVDKIFNDKKFSTIYINSDNTEMSSKYYTNIKSGNSITITAPTININGNLISNNNFFIESNEDIKLNSDKNIELVTQNGSLTIKDKNYNYTETETIWEDKIINTSTLGEVRIRVIKIGRIASLRLSIKKSWDNNVGTIGCIRVVETLSAPVDLGIKPCNLFGDENNYILIPMAHDMGVYGSQANWEVCGFAKITFNTTRIYSIELAFTKFGNGATHDNWLGTTTFIF